MMLYLVHLRRIDTPMQKLRNTLAEKVIELEEVQDSHDQEKEVFQARIDVGG